MSASLHATRTMPGTAGRIPRACALASLIAAAGLLLAGCSAAPDAELGAAAPAATNDAAADAPEQERQAWRRYFSERFPDVPIDDFVNGPYSVDAQMRSQWESIMEFPPFEFAVGDGEELFHQVFANGKGYADCFPNGGIGVRQNYPQFDAQSGQVVTLEMAVNQCRERNGEEPYAWMSPEITAISAYMSSTSQGQRFDIRIPDDPRALAAWEEGKQYWYTRRGQLGFACASCHLAIGGQRLRAERLAPALGIVAAFPIYRSKWGSMGTMSRRFQTCENNVGAKPAAAQSDAYRNLEYFLTYMSNELPVAGPGARP